MSIALVGSGLFAKDTKEISEICPYSLMTIIDDLKRDEGLRLKPYKDSEGFLTIGYGTLIEDISEEEAEWLLTHRFDIIMLEAHRQFKWLSGLSGNRREAILNMAYNLGVPRLKQFKNMIAALEDEDYSLAADEALDSKWARQVGSRAVRIAAKLRQG